MKKSSFKRSLALFMAILMLVTSVPILAFATNESGNAAQTGSSYAQPFESGNPSQWYRIPGMVTLDNGHIVAHGEARWNGNMDGGGNDSMIARSSDNGATWNYTMVNYYPDNGDVFDKSSTGTCDSAIATNGKRVYLLTTFFPAGYALNGSSANNQVSSGETAFYTSGNFLGKLKLKLLGDSDYNYYLGDFGSDGFAKILKNSDNQPVEGYTVDHDFYIYYNGTKDGNLFYSDCRYQTAKVQFLLFRYSDDEGATWSPFTLVNVKTSSEAFYGVGPGRGIVLEDGTIAFACYTWNGSNSSQRSSFIYSSNDGQTWNRMDNIGQLKTWAGHGQWTSEAQLVDLEDGTVRMFCRSDFNTLVYADAKYDSSTKTFTWLNDATKDAGTIMPWQSQTKGPFPVDYEINGKDMRICKDCQYSVLKYSKQIRWNGVDYDALICSFPSEGDSMKNVSGVSTNRTHGTVAFLLMNDKNEFVNVYWTQYTDGLFGYSSITELSDGSIASLYELDPYIMFDNKSLADLEKLSGFRIPDAERTYDIELIRGDTKTFYETVDNSDVSFSNSDSNIVSTKFEPRKGTQANMAFDSSYTGDTISMSDALYTFTKSSADDNSQGTHGSKMWNIGNMGVFLTVYKSGYPSTKERKDISIRQEGEYFQFVDGSNEALHFYRDTSKVYQFDRTTAYGTPGCDGSLQGGDYAATLFEVFRPAEFGETNYSSEVPGYIRVKDLKDIKDGHEYLIGCKIGASYYFLYPSLSTDNPYSHSVKCLGNEIDAGYFMIVNALKGGDSTVTCGLNTYNFHVNDFSREIIGVVDYDPVIYTHGVSSGKNASNKIDFTFVGDKISDGSYAGEKMTEFRLLDDSYTVEEISAVDAEGNIIGAVDFEDNHLVGTLDLAGTSEYVDYTKGNYATIKTVLTDSDGEKGTQTDRLYVASNPVPGHVYVATGGYTRYSTWNSYNTLIKIPTAIMAENSYGNTLFDTTDIKGVGSMYPYNLISFADYGFTYSQGIDTFTSQSDKTSLAKVAGSVQTASGGESNALLGGKTYSYTLDYFKTAQYDDSNGGYADNIVAYYYYDKSSDRNEGVTSVKDANGNPTGEFLINFKRLAERVDETKAWNNNVTVESQSVSKVIDSETGSINGFKNGGFSNFTVPVGADSTSANMSQVVQVSCSTDITRNNTSSLTGFLTYSEQGNATVKWKPALREFTDNCTVTNLIRFPFQIKICDKGNERDAFDKNFSVLRKSTDYTKDTWTKYMNSILLYEEYLNNYTIMTTDARRTYGAKADADPETLPTYEELLYDHSNSVIEEKYSGLVKRAKFEPLETALAENEVLYTNGISTNDRSYTVDSYVNFVNAYDNGVEFMNQTDYVLKDINGNLIDQYGNITLTPYVSDFTDEDQKAELPGYIPGPETPTSSADSPDYNPGYHRNQAQKDIEDNADRIINSQPVLAASDEAYLAAKELFGKLDQTAYIEKDTKTEIDKTFNEGDGKIYKMYPSENGRLYVNIPATVSSDESPIDYYTKQALEQMNVGGLSNENIVKKYNVALTVNNETKGFNGAQEVEGITGLHYYGEIVDIDFSKYFDPSTQIVECVATTTETDAETGVKNVIATTTVNLNDYADKGYIIPVLIQNDITFTLNVTEKTAKQVTVVDYYGTVIGTLTGDTVKVSGDTISNESGSVKAKNSPRYNFVGWSVPDNDSVEITEGMVISQVGTLIPGACQITAQGGKVNTLDVFNSNQLNLKITVKANADKPNAVWTRTVNGHETIASYEPNFVHFTSGVDVTYKAYDSIDALPENLKNLAKANTPVVSGVGYYANNRFTLSVDYSAPSGADVLDAGIVFTNTNPENLYKGGEGTATYAAPRIAHWSENPDMLNNSGTFTMSTSKNIDCAYMRAYVSYTLSVVDPETGKVSSTLPYVVYSDSVYKCEKQADGSYKVTAVN